MKFEQDYIMRMIKSIVSFFIKLITGKSDTVYELPSDGLYTPCDDIFARILSLADGGKINEAENLLYANVEPDSKDYLLMGLTFYSHINEYTDNFLSITITAARRFKMESSLLQKNLQSTKRTPYHFIRHWKKCYKTKTRKWE